MTQTTAILFDMDGTLLHWQDPARTFEQLASAQFGLVHQILAERGFGPPEVDGFASTLYARAAANWRQAMLTRRSFTVRDLFRMELPEMGLNVSEEDLDACVSAFESIPAPIGPKDGTVATLTALREQGLKLGLISNSWSTPACRDKQLRRAGLLELLPVRVYSSQMEVMKPHPAIFQRALSELGVTAAQALMVGDDLEMDVGGAQGVGLRGVWLDNRGQGLPADGAISPDAIVRTLDELGAVLAPWLES